MQIRTRGVGRPSETYPPERRCIPLSRWPEQDRLAWERARAEGDALEMPGAAASLAKETCRGRTQSYGRYLNFLDRHGLLLAEEGTGDRMTHDRLGLYLEEAERLLSANTIDHSLQELRRALQAMAPGEDWSWVTRHPAGPSRREVRLRKKRPQTFDSRDVCCKALDAMDHVSAGPLSIELLVWYWNALIVAVQCIFTLRRRNLAEMVLRKNLIVDDDEMRLVFTTRETKNYLPIQVRAPDFLKPHWRTFLDEHLGRVPSASKLGQAGSAPEPSIQPISSSIAFAV